MERLEFSAQYETIKEIPAYGFSGREDLEELWIPLSVRRIGRYAFYNCRNLKKITFYSHIEDVGSGAFCGCHQVRNLDVTIMKDRPSCLKDFLQELTEEVAVDYRVGQQEGGAYARLMFPEYYEEGVENTPARILMTQIHGSGLKYRNCFYKTEFLFEEYDERFPYAEAAESPEFLQELTLGRLMYPFRLSEKGKKRYEQYVKAHQTEIGHRLMADRDILRFSWLVEHFIAEAPLRGEAVERRFAQGGLARTPWDVLLEEAGRRGASEFTACLMEWRRRRQIMNGGSSGFVKEGPPEFEL